MRRLRVEAVNLPLRHCFGLNVGSLLSRAHGPIFTLSAAQENVDRAMAPLTLGCGQVWTRVRGRPLHTTTSISRLGWSLRFKVYPRVVEAVAIFEAYPAPAARALSQRPAREHRVILSAPRQSSRLAISSEGCHQPLPLVGDSRPVLTALEVLGPQTLELAPPQKLRRKRPAAPGSARQDHGVTHPPDTRSPQLVHHGPVVRQEFTAPPGAVAFNPRHFQPGRPLCSRSVFQQEQARRTRKPVTSAAGMAACAPETVDDWMSPLLPSVALTAELTAAEDVSGVPGAYPLAGFSPLAAPPWYPSTSSEELHFWEGTLMLVDASALLRQAYHKVRARLCRFPSVDETATVEADVVGTVFAFLDMMSSLVVQWNPSHMAVVFDHHSPTFRNQLYSSYKRSRMPKPDSLDEAEKLATSALLACSMKVVQVPGVEADDVIATMAYRGLAGGMKVQVASPDKDFCQLLGPGLVLLQPEQRRSRSGEKNVRSNLPGREARRWVRFLPFDAGKFREKFEGLEPRQFVDLLSLMGDKSDDVPGARGIGEKTAPRLLKEFGSVDELLEKVCDVKEKRFREALVRSRDSILLSRELIRLKGDVQVDMLLSSLRLRLPFDEGTNFWKLLTCLESDSLHMGSLKERLKHMLSWLWHVERSRSHSRLPKTWQRLHLGEVTG